MDGEHERSSRRVNNKRSHSEMASTRSASPRFPHVPHRTVYDSHYHNEHRASRPRLQVPTFERASLRLPPLNIERQPGDGLDLRVPIMSTGVGREDIVDLTNDENSMIAVPRPPRLTREDTQVIEIESDDEDMDYEVEVIPPQVTGRQRRETRRTRSQPSVMTLSQSRDESPLFVIDDELIIDHEQRISRNASALPGADESQPVIDLISDDEEEDLIITHERNNAAGVNGLQPTLAGGAQSVTGVGHIAGMLAQSPRLNARYHDHHWPPPDIMTVGPRPVVDHTAPQWTGPRWHMPSNFMHGLVGNVRNQIALVMQRNQAVQLANDARMAVLTRQQQPVRESYEAPPEPAEGFTRTPGEDEEVVCPNCGNELALGDTEEQRQVWVLKSCGHAYCGDCTLTRLRNIGKKGAKGASRNGQSASLTKCVVRGCQKAINKTTMAKVYLNAE